jgi:hypothetical protein
MNISSHLAADICFIMLQAEICKQWSAREAGKVRTFPASQT